MATSMALNGRIFELSQTSDDKDRSAPFLIISSTILMFPATTKWTHNGPAVPSQPSCSGLSKPKSSWTVHAPFPTFGSVSVGRNYFGTRCRVRASVRAQAGTVDASTVTPDDATRSNIVMSSRSIAARTIARRRRAASGRGRAAFASCRAVLREQEWPARHQEWCEDSRPAQQQIEEVV